MQNFSLVSVLTVTLLLTSIIAVKPGIDNDISALYGKRIGLITNPSGVNHELVSTIDLLFNNKNLKLVALFAPEHGLRGDKNPGEPFPDYIDPITNLTVYSLYNTEHQYAPTEAQIKASGLEALVVDLQDVGCRCYTYISTMSYCLKAAKEFDLPFFILDRVNPIGARDTDIQGPILDLKYKTNIGTWTIPMEHSMTIGEIAKLFNEEQQINHDKLNVIKLVKEGDENVRAPLTNENARWLLPSPNLPTLFSSKLYPGTVIFEALGKVSLGRGTTVPFSVLGAPYFENVKIIENLQRKIDSDSRVAEYFTGIKIIPIYFIPTASIHTGKQCAGIQLVSTSPDRFNASQSLPIAVTILSTLLDLYTPDTLGVSVSGMNIRFGRNETFTQILNKTSPSVVVESWKQGLNDWLVRRRKHLLY